MGRRLIRKIWAQRKRVLDTRRRIEGLRKHLEMLEEIPEVRSARDEEEEAIKAVEEHPGEKRHCGLERSLERSQSKLEQEEKCLTKLQQAPEDPEYGRCLLRIRRLRRGISSLEAQLEGRGKTNREMEKEHRLLTANHIGAYKRLNEVLCDHGLSSLEQSVREEYQLLNAQRAHLIKLMGRADAESLRRSIGR